MRRSTQRLIVLIAAIPAVLCLVAFIYQQGMLHLEDNPRTFAASLEWAAETITTTGYGHDSEWKHPFMQGFVIVVQFLGVFAVFLVFPVFLIPFFEERFEGRLPNTLPKKLKNHIVVYRWGAAVTSILEELDRRKVPVVIFEEDPQVARRLHDRGRYVLQCNLHDDDPDLSVLARARGVVVNGTDHENAVFTMSARQQGFDGTIVALAESPSRRSALRKTGADAVFSPKHALAAAIADKATTKILPRIGGATLLSDHLEVSEVRVGANSSLAGATLAEADVGAKTGTTIIGVWREGELFQADASTVIKEGAMLVAAGRLEDMRKLEGIATPVARDGAFVVCGFGDTGHKVVQLLTDIGEEVTIIDSVEQVGVSRVGDALDPELLTSVDVANAQAVILTLGNDTETVFACAVVRDLAPQTVIIASALRASNVQRIRRAGADYAFSISQVAGKLMAFQLLGEESMAIESQIKIAKANPGSLAGRPLLNARVREATSCSIVAVERGDDIVTQFDEHFALAAGDKVYVSGTQEAVDHYFDLYDAK